MIEINNLTRQKISPFFIKNFLKKIFRHLKIKKNLSLVFVGEKRIRKIKKTYLKIDKVTDVLSFPGEKKDLGEIIICLSQAKRQAKRYQHSFQKELKILIVHGLLHLLGFDHQNKKEKEKMEKKERELLKILE